MAISLGAQQSPQNHDSPTFTIKRNTQLVVETVTVTGKDDKPVEGLTARDFAVTEDGKPQEIVFCEFQQLKTVAGGAPLPQAMDAGREDVAPVIRNEISPEVSGDTRYRDRRLLVLYFDMTAMSIHDQIRALSAAQKFILTRMSPQDVVALMKFSGAGIQVMSDFTENREALLKQIRKMVSGFPPDSDDDAADDNAEPSLAFGQDAGEFNIFNIDRQLAALQTTVNTLSLVREKKALIYFAGGLRLNGLNNQAQFQATIHSALRANVAIYPVDARGLVAQSPLGDASKASPGGIGMYTGATALNAANNLQQSQNALYALAADTGGKALLDSNDIMAGIIQAQKAMSSYYVIGYYTSNTAADGKFRRIMISVKELAARLDYRRGYFASRQFNKFTASDKERQLQEALMLGDPITDLSIAMEIDYFRLNRAEYFVPVSVKIPGNELVLAHKSGAQRTTIDFIGEVKDQWGNTVTNVRDKVDLKLTDKTAAELAQRPVEYQTGFTLLPGSYAIKFLARDAETGRIGTYLGRFVIPNLNKEDKRVPISSVVLSSRRIDSRDALYTVGKANAEAVDPLVQDGQKLVPNVTKVFSRERNMYVYLQVYQIEDPATEPLIAYVTLYRRAVKVFETPLLAVKPAPDAKSKAVPLKFSINLNKLTPGRYNCQVTIIDPVGQKAAFWQAPVMLAP